MSRPEQRGPDFLTRIILRSCLHVAALVAMVPASGEAAPDLIERFRYRVGLNVQFQHDPQLDATERSSLLRQFELTVRRSFGRMWDRTIEQKNVVFPCDAEGLGRLTSEELLKSCPEEQWDKFFFVVFGRDGSEWSVASREYDVRSRTLSPVLVERTRDRRQLADTALRTLVRVFRPLLEVQSTFRDEVTLKLRAGEFPAPDPLATQVRVGDILRPFFRYLDKQRVVQRIQNIPNSYVVVQKVERGFVQGVLVSGLRMTLGTSGRRRVEQYCLRVRPHLSESNVRFVLRKNPRKELVGFRVRAFNKTRANEKTETSPLLFMSDRDGGIRVPVQDQVPLLWLYIQSGEALLARTPFVPGLEEDETLELLDDSIRLLIEGELDLVEGDLIDLVARRTVFMAFARKKADAGDSKGVEESLGQIDELPGLEEFRERVATLRVNAVQEAKATGNRVAESRVRRLCEKIDAVIQRYLAEDKMLEFRTQVREKVREAELSK